MNATIPSFTVPSSLYGSIGYSDSRSHGYQGSNRNVRIRATPNGGGSIARNEDGTTCAVTGKESLRILRVSGQLVDNLPDHKPSIGSATGSGGHRIDASRNFWDGSGLKIDSASTDIVWGHGVYSNKILTSARNGELIMWDLNQSGNVKYERRVKDHIRSIHMMSMSRSVNYCITGSADADLRVWDLRDLTKSIMRVHHPISVRSVSFSPSLWQPLQAVAGLDNGSIYRWDLKMGQRGQLDRVPVAHTAAVTALDWCSPDRGSQTSAHFTSNNSPNTENLVSGMGWLASGGLDRCVKVWDLTATGTRNHIPHKPLYTLHASFPIRRILWRPSYECELAIISNAEFATTNSDLMQPNNNSTGVLPRVGSGLALDSMMRGAGGDLLPHSKEKKALSIADAKVSSPYYGGAVEIWDVRKSWLAKWSVAGSAADGGVTDITFADSHALWTQYSSGVFSQIDLRDASKPLDAVPRVASTWKASDSMVFVADRKYQWEIPYDDIRPEQKGNSGLRGLNKKLGDLPAHPVSQSMGTHLPEFSSEKLAVITALARNYVCDGIDRSQICAANAEVALQAGQDRVARIWLLMSTSLADHSPNASSCLYPEPDMKVAILPTDTPPGSAMALANDYKEHANPNAVRNVDQAFKPPTVPPTPNSRKLTPTSSASSSPLCAPIGLPAVPSRRASFFKRGELMHPPHVRRSSLYRRPSISYSPRPNNGVIEKNGPSLRHVGEGALDDSDSDSGSEKEDEHHSADIASSEDESELRPLLSPKRPAKLVPNPSPLSRIARQQLWTEDENGKEKDDDDASSPSPRSTDTESDYSSSQNSPRSHKETKRFSHKTKSRSRSSTVASLAAVPSQSLVRRDSHSSIRTVTAAETSILERSFVQTSTTFVAPRRLYDRKILAHTSLLGPNVVVQEEDSALVDRRHHDENTAPKSKYNERRSELIRIEDRMLCDIGWDLIRDALEEFVEEGDVQMCAMLSIIAPQELRIASKRASRFFDSYIDLLARLRLYACSAYVRKYSKISDIRNTTLVETTIYTSCGKCGKSLLKTSANAFDHKGDFYTCPACKPSSTTCAICRLPVRSLLFQCAVCNHGGHQLCYRRYYLQQPAANRIPLTKVNNDQDGKATTTSEQKRLYGHLCVAGCGHYCWISLQGITRSKNE